MRENILPQWKLQWPASSATSDAFVSRADSAVASACECACDVDVDVDVDSLDDERRE